MTDVFGEYEGSELSTIHGPGQIGLKSWLESKVVDKNHISH